MLPCRVLRLYGMLEKVSDRQQHYRKAETAGSQLLQCLSLNVYPFPPTRYGWTVLDAWQKGHNSTYKNSTRSTLHLRPQHIINHWSKGCNLIRSNLRQRQRRQSTEQLSLRKQFQRQPNRSLSLKMLRYGKLHHQSTIKPQRLHQHRFEPHHVLTKEWKTRDSLRRNERVLRKTHPLRPSQGASEGILAHPTLAVEDFSITNVGQERLPFCLTPNIDPLQQP